MLNALSPALAQSNTQSATDAQLLACAEISDSTARTKCFDDIVNDLRQDTGASAPDEAAPESASSSSAAPAAAAATATATSDNAEPAADSAATPAAAASASTAGSAEPAGVAEEYPIYSRIATSQKSGDFHFVVTLENGQVWEETDGSRRPGLPKVGEEVRITEAALGGRRMKIGSDNRISWVRRLR